MSIACVIGNSGLGDMIVCIGIVNYIATKYKHVIVSCTMNNYEQIKTFYNKKNIIVYPVDSDGNTSLYIYDIYMRALKLYDIYAYGHYGAKMIDYDKYYKVDYDNNVKPIIHDYPISYYKDLNFPIDYMTQYFSVTYPNNILKIYDELFNMNEKYIVVHQHGSTYSFDIIKYNNININDVLVIDVNNNLYTIGHKYYSIASKFVGLHSVLYYTKLIENASALYLMDSCIHAIALIADITKANPKICYQREYRTKYGFNKFKYYLLSTSGPIDVELPYHDGTWDVPRSIPQYKK